MFPHSSHHTPVFSAKLHKLSSEALLPKIRSLWFGWEGPARLHSAAIQFPHPGMKTWDPRGAARPSQSEPLLTPCCEPSRQKALRESRPKDPSFFAPLPAGAAARRRATCLAGLRKDVCGRGGGGGPLGRFGKTQIKTAPRRWRRLEAALEKCEKV